MYGLRNFASVAVGMSRTPAKLFIPLNAVGAALWALSFGWGGYLFGEVMIAVVKDVKTHQMHILGIGCLVLLVFWGVRFFLRRRKRRKSQSL
jgi:membrane protein DedA with SNARE-associated domain